jgi:hypothetical protein
LQIIGKAGGLSSKEAVEGKMALGLNSLEVAGPIGSQAAGRPRERRSRTGTVQRLPVVSRAFMVGCVLALLQALDGVLTSLGVSRYGIAVEGNPLLRSLMEHFGHIPTLSLVKLIAISFVIVLSTYAKRLPWVQNAMGAISCIYLFTAILPWTYILFIQNHL